MKAKNFNFNLNSAPLQSTEFLIPGISNIDVRFAQLLISNLKEAKKEGQVLFFKPTRSFVEKLYYATDIKLNEQSLKRHMLKLISDEYLEEVKAQKWMYNTKTGKSFFYMVNGIVATDKLKDAISPKKNLIDVKRCKGCGETKLYKYFDKDKTCSNGLKNHCKECRKNARNKI